MSTNAKPASKHDLRRAIRRRRAAITDADYLAASTRVNTHLSHLLADVTTCAAYIPYGREPDITPTLDTALHSGTRILVPHLGLKLALRWSWLESLSRLSDNGTHGPRDPFGPSLDASAIATVSTIIIPALAVDYRGTRLGQGGGWYDRVLQYRSPTARTVAICYDSELMTEDELPRDDHDINMDMVITPSGVTDFHANA